jgi:DNA polymerase III subunit beta
MLKIKAGVLQNALKLNAGAISKNPVSEYFSCVLMQCQANELLFTTINQDCKITSSTKDFSGEVEDFCIDYTTLLQIASKYSADDELQIIIDEGFAKITKGRSSAKIQLLEVINFPQGIDIEEVEKAVNFNKQDLLDAINITKICIYANETRYNINGLHFNFQAERKKIDVVSTDGHRLSKFEIEDPELNFDAKITIPKKITFEIAKILNDIKGEAVIKMFITHNKVKIDFGNGTLITKLIDAEFPDYNRVIPTDNSILIQTSKPDISKAIDRVLSIADALEPRVLVSINETVMTLKTNNGSNEKTEEIDCETTDPFNFLVNAAYLKECVDALPSSKCVITATQSNLPFVIKDGEDARLLYVIMPMKS